MRAPVSDTAVFSDFSQAFPDQATTPNNFKPTGESAKRDRALRETRARVLRQGWINVTIVNLHPFPLDLNMGYLGHLTVPAKKAGEMYALKVLDQPRFDAEDKGDANFNYVAYMPKDLAEDLVKNFTTGDNDFGGVFYYEGVGPVPQDLLEEAQRTQLDCYWRLFQAGNANWSQFNRNPKFITDRMRDAAKELWRLRLVSAQPDWITITKDQSPDKACEGCGSQISKIAAFCPNCHTIYNMEWVKVKRPDIWKAQNPEETVVSSAVAKNAGASSVERADIDKYIADEEAQETARALEAMSQTQKRTKK